jgi:membrane dipeptidase
MSIYVSSALEGSPKAEEAAAKQIRAVRDLVRRHPEKFALVTSPAEVRRQAGKGRILLAMGMENGAPIRGNLKAIRSYHREGIRYITLAHAKNNHLADASYDTSRRWNGLSPFGREAVREMNRTGIMIDVSHLSDSAFAQVLRHSSAPVIASHSSCRAFTPGFERNMSDEMLRALASRGGVMQVNFGSSFLDNDYRIAEEAREKEIDRHLRDQHLTRGSEEARRYTRQYRTDHPLPRPGVAQVARHIDHAVRIAGIDHVGLGSDFDGVGDTLPVDLQDVSQYPNLIAELLRLGYAGEDLRKICGGNLLRVWEEVERTAAMLKGTP